MINNGLEYLIWIITKYLTTAAIVVLISEVAKLSDKLGGFLAALPLITLMALVWLHIDNQGHEKITNHAWYTFWYVIPTLPMFLTFPYLYKIFGFWLSLLACVVITSACLVLISSLLKRFGIELL